MSKTEENWIRDTDIMNDDIIYHCVRCGETIVTLLDKIKLKNGQCPGCERRREKMRKKFLNKMQMVFLAV